MTICLPSRGNKEVKKERYDAGYIFIRSKHFPSRQFPVSARDFDAAYRENSHLVQTLHQTAASTLECICYR
jgi:hypothetical protein